MAAEIDIRPAYQADLGKLERRMPWLGNSHFHEIRFRDQERGRITYLTAWQESEPVGHVIICWEQSATKEVRERYPHTPTLEGFEVRQDVRSQGIGSRLLSAAEDLVREKGYTQVGLSVGVDNLGAQRLYARSGYEDSGIPPFAVRWFAMSSEGRSQEVVEQCRFLVKALPPRA